MTDAEQDFTSVHAKNASTLLSSLDKRVIAVVKKNGVVLDKLNQFLRSGQFAANSCPILIIDDEAEQATINIGKREKQEQSTINKQIKKLASLTKVAYVAYTATPFANLLINPNNTEDLYPRDFIHVLPKPEGYYGSESIFGREPLSGDSDDDVDDGLPITRCIPEAEEKGLQPPTKTPPEEWDLYVPNSLLDAIKWFILASAARRARKQGHKHSSMLVHTSFRTLAHEDTAQLIKGELQQFTRRYNKGLYTEELRQLWEKETEIVPAEQFNLQPLAFDQVDEHIPATLAALKVVTDNQKSTERLSYSEDDPATVIAVGGNTLARGLTLEGLVVSYFVRNSSAYDTLLQMGRWFGFRPGYADLTRIWLTDELLCWFRDLASVEAELRQELARFASGNLTPMDYQARIRRSPYLEITSRAKAQELQEVSLSFSGQRVQTILFHHRDKSWLENNLTAARTLAARILQAGVPQLKKDNGTQVFTGVHTDIVLEFLSNYSFHEDSVIGRDSGEKLTGYINAEKQGSVREWNVSFFGKKLGKAGRDPESINLGLPDLLPLIRRSQTMDSKETANIKSLAGSMDRLNDINRSSDLDKTIKQEIAASNARREDILIKYHDDLVGQDVGHLIIYAIDKDSTATSSSRKNLDAVEHIIGVAIFFPHSTNMENSYDYVSAIKPDEELLDIYHEQEEEQQRIRDEEAEED